MTRSRAPADLVLVGAGHTHVEVLRRWITRPVPRTRLTLVVDHARAVYSGMVPGFVAGDYAAHEIEIDGARLARRAGAHVVVAPATAIDPVARRIDVADRTPLRYDVASLDVGGSVRGLELAGVRAHALATRPIRDFVDRLDAAMAAAGARASGAIALVVVGGGAAGVELGFTLAARARVAGGAGPRVTVLSDAPDVLPGDPPRMAACVRREAAARGIAIRTAARVTTVERDAVRLGDERLFADLVVWATGAAPPPLLATSSLPADAAGFVRVRDTLEVVGHDDLFAVGDCAAVDGAPWVAKAGVYAVREGPALDRNLRARLTDRPLEPFRPQRRFLSLLNLGDRRALATKWGLAVTGHWVWRWKRHIDTQFVQRYRTPR